MRKLDTNKTQILHRICLGEYNPEKPPADNYQEAQWLVDDNIMIPHDNVYTLAWEEDFGGHLFNSCIIYADPNATDFDESYTQGPDSVLLPRSYLHDSSDGENGKKAPLLTHLQYTPQIQNGMVKIKTLRPLQTYVILLIPGKQLG